MGTKKWGTKKQGTKKRGQSNGGQEVEIKKELRNGDLKIGNETWELKNGD
jgi:hypothetical protein